MPSWIYYSILATIAGGVSIALAKLGMKHSSEGAALFIRTAVLFISVSTVAFVLGDIRKAIELDRKSLIILAVTGVLTAAYWLLYFKALKEAHASHVAAIDKASIVVTVIFSVLFLKEQLTQSDVVGIIFILLGCLLIVLKT